MRILNVAHREAPDIASAPFNPDEALPATPFAPIDQYPWDGGGYKKREARAYLFWNEGGLTALLCAREDEIFAQETRFCGRVCDDSCLELFLTPCPDRSPAYVNVEINPLGTVHMGFGDGRPHRTHPAALPEDFHLQVSRHEGDWWAVRFTLSAALLEARFGLEALRPGLAMRANFYACGELPEPHYAAWNPVNAPAPDYHRPEQFGLLALEG